MSHDDGVEHARFRYGSVTIAVAATDAGVLAWLTEFLTPAFSQDHDATPAAYSIRFDIDPTRHARLERSLASAPAETFEGFTIDGRFLPLRGWTDPGGELWVRVERGAFCGVSHDGAHIAVVAEDGDRRDRGALMRVVRELATAASLRDRLLPVHAAAFQHDDDVILICGPKRSGKTSLLMHALGSGGRFVTNDRVFLDPHDSARAHSLPTIVVLRDGALDLFPDVKRRYDERRFDYGRTIALCAAGLDRPAPAPAGKDRPGISPPQFCRLLGAEMSAGGRVRMIVFPRIRA